MKALTIALPKGRLFSPLLAFFSDRGIVFDFGKRKLTALDASKRFKGYMVKNHDLPAYVHHGIAGLGIAGDDTVAESGFSFVRVANLPFGGTRLCLAGPTGSPSPEITGRSVVVATSYVRMTRSWFHARGIPVKIIKLDGSVELAPTLGLADYIVDLVETGSTLRANGLEVISEMETVKVRLNANPAYFKLHYRAITELADTLNGAGL